MMAGTSMTVGRSTSRTDLARFLLVAAILAPACTPPAREPRAANGRELASITVTSKDFLQGGRIPIDDTCDGKDRFPELSWSAAPEGTRSIVVIVDDPDAQSGVFTHLLLYNIGPEVHRVGGDRQVEGARHGTNDMNAVRYSGPCPPRGEAHRYRFRVVALDTAMDVREGLTRAEVDATMDGHVLGEGQITAIFGH